MRPLTIHDLLTTARPGNSLHSSLVTWTNGSVRPVATLTMTDAVAGNLCTFAVLFGGQKGWAKSTSNQQLAGPRRFSYRTPDWILFFGCLFPLRKYLIE